MNHDADDQAAERLNAGEPVPPVDPVYLKNAWEVTRNIPTQRRDGTALGLGAIAGGNAADRDLLARDAGQRVAFMVRFAILHSLLDRGVLNDCMQDDAQRARVFQAAATMPCDKNDFFDAMSQRILRDSPPDVAAKTREEMLAAGLDPDHPKVIAKFIAWMEQQA